MSSVSGGTIPAMKYMLAQAQKQPVDEMIIEVFDFLCENDLVSLALGRMSEEKANPKVSLIRIMADIYDYLKGFFRVMINPVVIEESPRKCEYNEGCLSIPGIYADVARPDAITVEYYNEHFEKVTEHFDKFACRMIQHEMSHLDGKLFTDLVAPIRKKILGKKLLNIAKGKVSTRYNAKIR